MTTFLWVIVPYVCLATFALGHVWRYRFDKFDGYKEGFIAGTSSELDPGNTRYLYDQNGRVTGIVDGNQHANDRTFVNDVNGTVLQTTQGAKILRNVVVNGEVLGQYGVGMDPSRPHDARLPASRGSSPPYPTRVPGVSPAQREAVEHPGGPLLVNVLGQSDVVGEAAIFGDVPRSATATARTRLEALRVCKDLFLELVRDNAEAAMQLNRILATRLANTTAQLGGQALQH